MRKALAVLIVVNVMLYMVVGVRAQDSNFRPHYVILTGSGAPVVSASPGALYLNTLGGSGTTLYVKESGTGSAGWVGK